MLGRNEIVLTFANGARVTSLTIRTFHLYLPSRHVLVLKNYLYYKNVVRNIIAICHLSKENYKFSFTNDRCSIYHNKSCVGIGLLTNNLYTIIMSGNPIIDVNNQNRIDINAITNKHPRDSPNPKCVPHLQLGHIGEDRINKLSNEGYIDPSMFELYSTCDTCLLGKMTKAPFVGHNAQAIDILGLIHTDVYKPFNETARNGYSHFIIFTNDQSWYGFLY